MFRHSFWPDSFEAILMAILLFFGSEPMLTVITYDVNTEDAAGQRRLRKVAKHCVNYGQRVQNSVFECVADAATMAKIKAELIEIADLEKDSLRFYYLGNNYARKIEYFGAKASYEAEGFLEL